MRPFLILSFGYAIVSGVLASAAEPGESIFGLTKIHNVQVTVNAADYTKMDPPPRPAFGGPRPAGAANRPAPGSPDFGAGNFGFEFEYVPASIVINGQSLSNVGLRYKGSGTYMMSTKQAKRSLKFDFDRYDDKLAYQGFKKLNLNSGVMDPSKQREVLAYAVFRAAGIPAPRTAFAEVSLTVPDKYDQELLGVFTMVEQINKAFLKNHFQNGKGLLLKPEGIRGLPHFGPDAKSYAATYVPKDEATAEEWQRLVELTRLINVTPEEEFQKHIGEYLDLDACAGFIAANTAVSSMDGFLGLGHNYYLYLVPSSRKFVFIPWDLDLAFGAFPMYGSSKQLLDLSIEHPHVGQNKLLDRLSAMPEWKAVYRRKLQQICDEVFTPAVFGQWLTEVAEALKQPLKRDKTAAEKRREPVGGGMFGTTSIELAQFMEQRKSSLEAQLAGKSRGYTPTQTQGFGGFAPPANGGLGRPLFQALDQDQDGKLSEAELAAGMKKLRDDWDTNRDGQLDQREWNNGLQKLPGKR